MNPVMFNIGKIEFKWYSFFILMAVIIGFILALVEGKREKIDKDLIFDMGFYTVIFGILGARLYYVLFNFNLYQNDFLEVFRLWNGGLAIHGGIIAGLLTIYIFSKTKKVKVLSLTDLVVPSLILGQAIGRWGNFFNSEAHGPVTTMANLKALKIIPSFVVKGMKIGGIYYHPTFYYEFLWCILGFVVLWAVRKFYKNRRMGQLTCLYLMFYSLGRFFIESLRTDSLTLGAIKIAQVVSAALFVCGLVFFVILSSRKDVVKESKRKTIKKKTNGEKIKKEKAQTEKKEKEIVKETEKIDAKSIEKSVSKKSTRKKDKKSKSNKSKSE